MRIVCPQCGYSREIPANKIPTRSSVATCPKCRFRFRFREDSRPAPAVVNTTPNEPAYPPRPSRPSSTASREEMRPAPSPYVSPRGVTYQPLPDDVWEPQTRPARTLKPAARWLPDPEPGEEAPAPRRPDTDRRGRGRESSPWPDPPERSWTKPETGAAGRSFLPEPQEQPRSWRPAPKPDPARGEGSWRPDGQAAGREQEKHGPFDHGSDRGHLADHGSDRGHLADHGSDRGHLADHGSDIGRLADQGPDRDRLTGHGPDAGRAKDERPDHGHNHVGDHASEDDLRHDATGPTASSSGEAASPQDGVSKAQYREPGRAFEAQAGDGDDFLTEESVSQPERAASDTAGRDASGNSLSELGEALRGGEPASAPDTEPSPPPEPPKPPEPDFWDSARQAPRNAHEATTGDEPVRDIWARLQAMGGDPVQSITPGKEGKPPKETSHMTEGVAPWDEFEQVGVAPAFLKTVRNVLFKPGDFFEALEPEAGRVRPLIFAVVVSELVVLFWMIWKFFGMGPAFSELTRTEGFQGLGAGGLGSVALLGLAPVLMVGFSYLDAALSHFLLGLLRGVSRPFEATFRLLCYAGAPWLLAAAPVPLPYLLPVVIIWHMTLQAIGLKKQHQASGYAQVLASVLVKWSFYLMVFFAVYVLALRS